MLLRHGGPEVGCQRGGALQGPVDVDVEGGLQAADEALGALADGGGRHVEAVEQPEVHRVDVLPHRGHPRPQARQHLGGIAPGEEQSTGVVILAEGVEGRPHLRCDHARHRRVAVEDREEGRRGSPRPCARLQQEVTDRHERMRVVAMVLVHHLANVADARLDVGLQLRVVEGVQVDIELAMTGDRRRLQLVVPATHGITPDALLEGLGGHADPTPELGADPLRVLGPVGAGEVEGLGLVVGEPVDGRHREAVEQHAIDLERLLEPAVEPGGIRLLKDRSLRHRVVRAVLLPGSGPRCLPIEGGGQWFLSREDAPKGPPRVPVQRR